MTALRQLRGLWSRLDMWWNLHGQFSRPVRMISPRRRAVHAEVERRCAEPGYMEAVRQRLAARISQSEEEQLLRAVLSPETSDQATLPDHP